MVNNINSVSRAMFTNSNNFNVRFPNTRVGNILTGNRSKLSDEEYKEKIMELARQDVAKGINSKFVINDKNGITKTGTDEWHQLNDDYTYSKSPSRKGVINNTLSGLSRQLSMMGIVHNPHSIFDAIFKNSTAFGSKDVGANFVNFKDFNGTPLAGFSNTSGWSIYNTNAEETRNQEFLKLWDKAIIAAKKEKEDAFSQK